MTVFAKVWRDFSIRNEFGEYSGNATKKEIDEKQRFLLTGHAPKSHNFRHNFHLLTPHMITNKNIIHLITIIRRQPMDFDGLDHVDLFNAAKLHRVTALIYRSLLTYTSIPQSLLELFKEYNRKNHYKALQQLKLLTGINRELSQHNIPMLCIKGLMLSHQLYGDIGMRTSRDIDILVAEKNMIEIDFLLKRLGFQGIETKKVFHMLTVLKDISYYHPRAGMTVEVHCQLLPRHMKFYSFDELWDSRKIVQLSNGEIFNVLPPELEWMYLCIHGSYSCYMRLQWLCDIVNYQQRYPYLLSNDLFQKEMKRFKLTRYYNMAHFFIKLFYRCPAIEQQSKNLFYRFSAKLMQRRKSELSAIDSIMLRIFYWLCADDYSEKWKLILHQAKHHFFLLQLKNNLPPKLFFLYFPFYYLVVIPVQIGYRLVYHKGS